VLLRWQLSRINERFMMRVQTKAEKPFFSANHELDSLVSQRFPRSIARIDLVGKCCKRLLFLAVSEESLTDSHGHRQASAGGGTQFLPLPGKVRTW